MLPRGFESLPLRHCLKYLWRGARVVEGNGLENRQARKGLVGSNPTLSAIKKYLIIEYFFMDNPKIIIKRPQDCTKSDIKQFEKLVVEGGQVNTDGLDKKIKECMFLAFCYANNELASIAALKNKSAEYVESVYAKTGEANSKSLPLIEIGYCFTNHHHRGKKYNSNLVDKLLLKVKDKSVFATTGNPVMKSFFEKRGFRRVGKPYAGIYNKDIILYFKNI